MAAPVACRRRRRRRRAAAAAVPMETAGMTSVRALAWV